MPKLAIDIEAKYAQVMDALDQIGRKADSQAKSIQSAFRGVGAVLGGVLSVAAIKSELDAFEQTLDLLGSIDDAAKIAGTSVESFSEAFFWLQPTGVSVQQLTDLSGLLFKQLAKGGDEGKKAAAAFAEVGVKARDAAGNIRDPIEVLREFAVALSGYENDANKVVLVNEALGRSAAQYLPLLEDLAKMQGDGARVTGDFASKASDLADKLKALAKQGEMLRVNFLLKFIDDITEVVDKLNLLSSSNVGIFDKVLGMVGPNKELARINEDLATAQKRLESLENYSGRFFLGGDERRKRLIGEQKALIETLKERQRVMSQAVAIGQKYDKGLRNIEDRGFDPLPPSRKIPGRTTSAGGEKKDAETEAEKVAKWLSQQEQSAAKLNVLEQAALKIAEAKEKAGHGITSAIEDELLARARGIVEQQKAKDLAESQAEFEIFMSKVLADDARRAKDLADAWREVLDPAEQYRKKLREITELEAGGHLNESEASAARQSVIDQMESLDRQRESIAEIDEYARNAAQSMQQSFSDFLFDPFEKGLKGLADSFARTVQRMAADALAAQLMRSLFGDYAKTGALGGILGSVFGAGTGMSTNSTDTTLRALEGLNGIDYGGFSSGSTGVSLTQNVTIQSGAGGVMDFATKQALREATISGVRDAQVRGELR